MLITNELSLLYNLPSIWRHRLKLISKCCVFKVGQYNWAATWDFQQCDICEKQKLRSACAHTQSDQSLYLLLDHSTSVKLPTEHHLEFLSLKGGCTGSSESTFIKMPHCLKSHVAAHMFMFSSLVYQHSPLHLFKAAYSVTMNIFRKFLFYF